MQIVEMLHKIPTVETLHKITPAEMLRIPTAETLHKITLAETLRILIVGMHHKITPIDFNASNSPIFYGKASPYRFIFKMSFIKIKLSYPVYVSLLQILNILMTTIAD